MKEEYMEEVEKRLNRLLEINRRLLTHLEEINRLLSERQRK
ncbi:hypothetical protein [Pyrobaculum sp.]